MCKKDEGIVMPNFAALRAEVFPLSTKNLRGGADIRPPVGARVNIVGPYTVKSIEIVTTPKWIPEGILILRRITP